MTTTQATTAPNSSTRRTLGALDRLQPVLLLGSIAAGLGLAKASPRIADSTGPLVNVGVLVLMYLVMLGVSIDGMSHAFRQRRFLGIAVFLNFVLNPALAWALGSLFLGGHPDLRLGLILFLVTPCIGWYLLFSELAGGDASLGLSILGVNIVLQVLLLPLYLAHLGNTGQTSSVNFAAATGSVATFLVLPAVAAATTRTGSSRFGLDVNLVRERVDAIGLKTVVLMMIIISMFASQADVVFDNPTVVLRLFVPLCVFFALAFAVALIAGRASGLPYEQTALLAFTTTSRNSEASLAIAATAFASPLVGLTVIVGPVVELPLLVLMVRVLRSYEKATCTSHEQPVARTE